MNKKTMITIIGILIFVISSWSIWGFFISRVEQTEYTVLKTTDVYEIREYPAHIVAQTTIQGSYRQSMSEGFRIVAGYIFGGNTKNESIAMTAPVVSQEIKNEKKSENIAMTAPVISTIEGDSQTISFGMPRSYTLDTLPTPTDPRVKIVTIPKKNYAVIRFLGYRSEARIKRLEEKLITALTLDGVAVKGSISYAGYNGPLTPPWMNRNEVLVEVVN